jgi:hypothetical protein
VDGTEQNKAWVGDVYTDTPHCPHKEFQQNNSHIKPSSPSKQGKYKYILNPLTPELNPSAQRCLTRFLLEILLLEPRIS